jgi:hypothetical protein
MEAYPSFKIASRTLVFFILKIHIIRNHALINKNKKCFDNESRIMKVSCPHLVKLLETDKIL